MPQVPVETNDRMFFPYRFEDRLLMRAAAIQHANLTEFVLQNIISAAKQVIEEDERFAIE